MLFLMLYQKGLAYQDEALVNYDPVDKTVLANEQVDSGGRSWRSGALVQQIKLRQWFFRIKAFQEDLLKDLAFLSQDDRWPERVIAQQRNWLGKSHGARVRFELLGGDGQSSSVHVFTTRPDTLFGVTYLALSLSHPTVTRLAALDSELQEFVNKKASFTPDSKAGFELPIRGRNPVSSDPAARVPVFAAPYVLEDYGEGAVMGVPAHDARDLAFWKVHRSKTSFPVAVQSSDFNGQPLHMPPYNSHEAFTGSGVLTDLCGKYAGKDSKEGGQMIVAHLALDGRAEMQEIWRLRDWLVSRQRYWGTPIPIVHCHSCGAVPVPEAELPIVLPKLPESLRGQTGNPLEKIPEWVNCRCPRCKQPARRETDTMDTFVDSSWYYARFTDPHNNSDLFSKEAATSMLPVDTYIGGVEHAILHLLYARFIFKFLCSEGMIPPHSLECEPFQQLIAQGMVHGKTFTDPETGRFLLPDEVDLSGKEPMIIAKAVKANISWEKMSKSKHNGVDPSTCIEKYGADATRAHVLFSAPISEVLQWDEQSMVGIQRWYGRIRELAKIVDNLPLDRDQPEDDSDWDVEQYMNYHAARSSETEIDLLILTQDTIRAVTRKFDDIYSLNTTVSDLMKLTNALYEVDKADLQFTPTYLMISALLQMLAPIAPAFARECFEDIGISDKGGALTSEYDLLWPRGILPEDLEQTLRATKKSMVCAVQVNGKFRFAANVPAPRQGGLKQSQNGREQEVLQAVLGTEEGRIWLSEKNDAAKAKRVVVAGDGKLLNVVF